MPLGYSPCHCGRNFISDEALEKHQARDHSPAIIQETAAQAVSADSIGIARARLVWQLRLVAYARGIAAAAISYDTLHAIAEEGTFSIEYGETPDKDVFALARYGFEAIRVPTVVHLCRLPPKHKGKHVLDVVTTRPLPEFDLHYQPSERASEFAILAVPIEEALPFFMAGDVAIQLSEPAHG